MRLPPVRQDFCLIAGSYFASVQLEKASARPPEVVDGPMKLLRIIPLVLIVLGAAMLSERPAYGYTDPGTGLLALQAAGSALVATGWYLRRKLHTLFRSREQAELDPARQPGLLNTEEPPRV